MAGKTLFNIPYAGVDKNGDYDLLIGLTGECSVIIQMTNPVIRYSAYPAGYDEFHHLLINIVKVLGDGYLLQKQDIISRSPYKSKPADEYLQQKYNAHFDGRECLKVDTYLTITRQVKKGAFYVYDARVLRDFLQAVGKVLDILPLATVLKEARINQLVMQMLSMDFKSRHISLDNIAPGDTEIKIGKQVLRNISLVNIDSNLSFNNGKEGIYPGDALLQLKGKNETLLAAINNTSCLQLNDYKALYKISLLQDLGRGKDIWQALEIARDHPGIWKDSLVGVDQAIGSKQTQLVGR